MSEFAASRAAIDEHSIQRELRAISRFRRARLRPLGAGEENEGKRQV
ncbi:MAG: hypothetical protein IT167_07975 [Bryobacterales bacterium]|nr:hypothetical protein [Bryobacterales bacterium]